VTEIEPTFWKISIIYAEDVLQSIQTNEKKKDFSMIILSYNRECYFYDYFSFISDRKEKFDTS